MGGGWKKEGGGGGGVVERKGEVRRGVEERESGVGGLGHGGGAWIETSRTTTLTDIKPPRQRLDERDSMNEIDERTKTRRESHHFILFGTK